MTVIRHENVPENTLSEIVGPPKQYPASKKKQIPVPGAGFKLGRSQVWKSIYENDALKKAEARIAYDAAKWEVPL